MAPKKSKTIKTKAKRVFASSYEPAIAFDQIRFETVTDEQRFDKVIQHRNIWPERQINLDVLPPFVHSNLQCRNWLSLCKDLHPLPIALIRELYANLHIRSDDDLELIHITAPIGATFLKQRSAQKKNVGLSVGSSKRPRVQALLADVHAEESLIDPKTAVANDGDDEVHVDSADAEPTIPPPLSLRALMETFMTTQAAYGQLLDGLIAEVAALRAEF
nr:hypothetical protein CFP56_76793 [Quercus suber]